jgi:hypothetical protein
MIVVVDSPRMNCITNMIMVVMRKAEKKATWARYAADVLEE